MHRKTRAFIPGERIRIIAIGFAQLLDGVVLILSLGEFSGGYAVAVSKRLAMWRWKQPIVGNQ
jgi:hypothetical protein